MTYYGTTAKLTLRKCLTVCHGLLLSPSVCKTIADIGILFIVCQYAFKAFLPFFSNAELYENTFDR